MNAQNGDINHPGSPDRILETCLYAENLEEVKTFYQDVMCLELVSEEAGRHLFFRCGQGMFLVFNPVETMKETQDDEGGMDIPAHGAKGASHVAFRIPAESYAFWKRHFMTKEILIEREIEWPRNGKSMFIRDPGNNSVEVATPGLWGLD